MLHVFNKSGSVYQNTGDSVSSIIMFFHSPQVHLECQHNLATHRSPNLFDCDGVLKKQTAGKQEPLEALRTDGRESTTDCAATAQEGQSLRRSGLLVHERLISRKRARIEEDLCHSHSIINQPILQHVVKQIHSHEGMPPPRPAALPRQLSTPQSIQCVSLQEKP